jgi:hypothetical protein
MAVTMSQLAGLIVIDIIVVAGISILMGALAPRWPGRWLTRDHFPLTLLAAETPTLYRRLRIPRLARRLPELGATFGGASKSVLPGTEAGSLELYLREVRRAEWVHWISVASPLILFAFNPWWLALVFLVGTAAGNAPFILLLRNNRIRILRIIDKGGRRS